MGDKWYRLLVQLDKADAELLEQVVFRLHVDKASVVRWALRWYAINGPWRSPDEPLLPAAQDRLEGLQVGPFIHRGEDV